MSIEQQWVEGLRAGDAAAFRATYSHFAPRLHGFLARMVGDPHAAQDLLQETWLSLARHARELDADVDLAAWLFTVARNKARNWRRWAMFDRLRIELFSGEPRKTEQVSAEIAYCCTETQRSMEGALVTLSDAHREVLLLVAVEGLDATQVGEILGIRADAVRQRLSRARAELARQLQRIESPPVVQAASPGGVKP